MRVIAGIAKGRKLKTLNGNSTRPTADRVKEALFSILGDLVVDCRFLDLFAGTGNIGIEALSRGANYAIFVEKNLQACLVIKENLTVIGLEGQSEICNRDVLAWLNSYSTNESFDLVYIDPPYEQDIYLSVLLSLEAYGVISYDSVIITEYATRLTPCFERQDKYKIVKSASYGDTTLAFLRLI